MNAQRNTVVWFALLLALLFIGALLRAQVPSAQQASHGSIIDNPVTMSLLDLRSVGQTLKNLRANEVQECQKQEIEHSNPRDPLFVCNWHQPFPADLRDATPETPAHEISGIEGSPYSAYELQRYQTGLLISSLVSTADVKDGENTFSIWRHLADSGGRTSCVDVDQVFNDPQTRPPDNVARARSSSLIRASFSTQRALSKNANTNCLVVVRNTIVENLEVFSACDLVTLDGISGAPEHCTPIAASSSQNEHWIRAIVGMYRIELASNGTPDFTFNLFAYSAAPQTAILSSSGITLDAVHNAVKDALRAAPLAMLTHDASIVRAVAPQRTSPVLGKEWNEKATVIVEIESHEESGQGKNAKVSYDIAVATSILLNEQKDPNPEHWHQPTEAQTNEWTEAIRKNLVAQFKKLCHTFDTKDEYTINCPAN